jgi:hypothetical protein
LYENKRKKKADRTRKEEVRGDGGKRSGEKGGGRGKIDCERVGRTLRLKTYLFIYNYAATSKNIT